MGATEQSPAHGSCVFRAPHDVGEGSWVRSQARGKSGPATETCCIDARRRHREPEGKTRAQISPSIEVECRERDGSSADARQKEAITRGRGCVVVTVAAALT